MGRFWVDGVSARGGWAAPRLDGQKVRSGRIFQKCNPSSAYLCSGLGLACTPTLHLSPQAVPFHTSAVHHFIASWFSHLTFPITSL